MTEIKKIGIHKKTQILDLQTSWNEDSERLILYADIMGFKDRVM